MGAVLVRFTFSPFAEMRTIGEIIWMDEENKIGGLQFRDLPGLDRANIRRWLEQNALPLPPRADLTGVDRASSGVEAANEFASGPVIVAEDGAAGATIPATARGEASPTGAFAPTSEFTEPWRPPAGTRVYQPDVYKRQNGISSDRKFEGPRVAFQFFGSWLHIPHHRRALQLY